MDPNRELWNEYRQTWKTLTAYLDQWQNSPQPEESLREAERLRAKHNAARDRLAEHLTSREHRVRNTARLIWEFAGRPEGTADSDWFKAEDVWK